jgi:hypothetical protein
VHGHALAELFTDGGLEGEVVRGHERGEGVVAGLEAARERARVECAGQRSAIFVDGLKPEGAEVLGLLDTFGGKEGVKPGLAVSTIEEGPVTLWLSVSTGCCD